VHQDKFEFLGMEYIILAGSYVRGDATEKSDIDIFISLPEINALSSDEKWDRLKQVNSIYL